MDHIEERFRHSYWTLVHYIDAVRLRTWEERGVTLPQLRVLFQIRADPGVTTNVLARRLGLTAATVSGLLDKLARSGLVERGARADDRRVIPLKLTDEGEATVGAIREGNKASLGALAAQVGADLPHITEALELLAAHIERIHAPAAEEESSTIA